MKMHVFVATTQGLVAIQRIYAQDPDIRSVVSINGTATVSAISAAYHHFVKKGVGIIENDFGGSAYRVNIEGHIDQGSSWQLGFYLAHAAHAQNILGEGNPQPGDRVICATGEINTSERAVLAVEQIPLKIQRASSQIQDWPGNIQSYFLLPWGNASESLDKTDLSTQLYWIDSLEDALKFLPENDENTINSNLKGDKEEVSANTSLLSKRVFNSLTSRWIVLGLALLLAAGLYFFSDTPKEYTASPLATNSTSKNLPAVEPASPHDTLVSRASMDELSTLHADDLPGKQQEPVQDKAVLQLGYADEDADEKQCPGAELEYLELHSVAGKFKPAPYQNLCEIRFVAEQNYSAVFAINRVSHRFIRAVLSDQAFVIPRPGQGADYLLLAVKGTVDTDHYRKLHGYLFNLADETILSAKELSQLPALQDQDYGIFSHQLTLR